MAELFTKEGKLIQEQDWKELINQLKEQTAPSTKEALEASILEAIKKRIPKEKFGLFLSGGVDSSFLAMILKKLNADFIAVTIGVENSPDVENARKFVKELKIEHQEKILTLDELEAIIPEVMKITKKKDIVTIGVGAVEYAGLQVAQKHNLKIMFGGLGTEEIFAGYQRHENVEDINEECWDGLRNMWERDLTRDYALFSHFNVEARTPFMDEEVIKQAMGIEGEKKLNKDFKKIIFREIAEAQGLHKDIAWRKKKAAQYGSRIIHAIDKLAKRKNLKYKKEYLATFQV